MPARILVVDDYPVNVILLAEWLAREHYVVSTAADGLQALTNEITIKDIAEGFDRAIKTHPRIDKDQPFDAIVHSTGMLVLRSWLATNPIGRKRLKHLIGLAPATFGSPLAQ